LIDRLGIERPSAEEQPWSRKHVSGPGASFLTGLGAGRESTTLQGMSVKKQVLHRQSNSGMDHCAISVSVFHKFAARYREKFMDLTMYDDTYRQFCGLIRRGHARVLDAACGPGNVSRFMMAQRPDLDLLGIDLAPGMVELAREAVPSAQFALHDCRNLADLKRRFDGIICAFGLPYLMWDEVVAFIEAACTVLEPGGVLYLSTMLGRSEDSGFQRCSSLDQVYINYHGEDQLVSLLQRCDFRIVKQKRIQSPSVASKATTDLIVITKK
jgi:SAM-dependent methyltransferase